MKIDVPIPGRPDWERVTARRLFENVRRDPRETDGIVTAFRDGQVTLRSNRRVEGFTNAVQEIGYQGVRVGDLIIHSMDGFAGAIGVSDSDGKASPVVHCYVPSSGTEPRYYTYLLRVLAQGGFITSLAKGIRERSTAFDVETFRSLLLPHPPLVEQRAIADHLDAETAHIDALIAKKQQLVHLIEERRSRLTLAGVVGELSHDGAVRESGLEWAGAIPSHWDAALLRLVARQGTGHTPSRSHPEWWIPEECVVPWVTTGEVQQVRSDRTRVITETREKISRIGIANSSAEIHPEGTVFLCRTASAGYSGIMGVDMATSQDFATWTCGELLDAEYLLFCLRAMRPDLLGRLAMGSTHKTIYMPDIQALKIPVPPIAEQRQIAALLKDEIDRSFAVDDALATQVRLLAERRQTLISAAVTGEIALPSGA